MINVVVYSAPNCPWCVRVKEFLKENKIKFKEVDVAEDEKAAQEMIKKSGQMGVPVTEVNGEMIVGFNKPMLKKFLKIK